MNRPRYEILLRYRLFRNWWAKTLANRKNNLYDFETGQPMDIKKRIFQEKPKLDDLFSFLVAHKVWNHDVSYDMIQENYRCEIFRADPPARVVARGLNATDAAEAAVIQFLKVKIKP
jgi:hypothetical protein